MEYHQDRFDDFSLLVFQNEKLVAIFPANKSGDTVFSHQGLTYGGLALSKGVKFEVVLNAFKEVLKFLCFHQIGTLVLKQIPSIYCILPSDEVQYLMFILKAKLIRRDTLSVIDLNKKLSISKDRMNGFKRAQKFDLSIIEENTFENFWEDILIPNIYVKYDTKPVHDLEEITSLKKRFPKNIRQFNVYNKDKIVAGTTIFETKNVAHSQYISGDEDKNRLGSLDYLHIHLINEVFKGKKFFDFGISNENQGRQINKGLQYWKEGLGARTISQDFYEVKTENFQKLNTVFV